MNHRIHRSQRILRTAVALAAAALLTACAGQTSATTGASGATTDTPTPAMSPSASSASVEDPGVVVALDDFAALTVMSLGITPDLAFDTFGYRTSQALFADAGIQTAPYGQVLDLERVIAADPDVIIGVSLPTTVEQQATLEGIAPTVVLDYSGDWRTGLQEAAEVLGATERAAEVEALVDQEVQTLRADLEAAGKADVASVLAGSTDSFFSPPSQTNLGVLLEDVGLQRPAAQQAQVSATAPFVDVTAEQLPQHDGDVLYVLAAEAYPVEPLKASPLFDRLQAVQQGRVFEVSGEMWFGANPLSALWVLHDVRATLLEGGQPLSEDAVVQRLAELQAA